MKKRIMSLLLALMMLIQILVPQKIFAEGDSTLPHGKYTTVGKIDYKAFDSKTLIEMNKVAARNRKTKSKDKGVSLYSPGPYFGDDNEPTDEKKLKYHGNVKAKLSVKGLNGGEFQWNEIFGVDKDGNPKPAQLIFTQINDDTGVETGVERYLKITEAGTYAWTDGDKNPAELPLFNNKFEPFSYEVRIDENVADKVKLLTATFFGSEDASPTFEEPDADGRIKFNLTLELTLGQVTSTKFTSKWNTGLKETDRPQIQADATFSGTYMGKEKTKDLTIDLPKNDTDEVIVRDLDDQGDPNLVIAERLNNKPNIGIKKDTQGLTFEENNEVKTVKSGDHKFEYDFTYDVINGGKLTMTEIIPVTFDANGGKFASITEEGAKQEIIKEVDYDGTLTDKAETPTKPGKAFKGWTTDKDGKIPATDSDYKDLKAAKTFYAIWSDEDIQVEELKTTESFGSFPRRGEPKFTNDFVPTFEDLKRQVKVKDANGDFVALPDDVKFSIVDGTKEYTEDSVDLKKFLYDKVKENKDDEVSRTETVKAKVKYSDGTERKVEIPITVLKNIYKGSDQGGRFPHIPDDYVKVTVDPTDKAQNPDKAYYYVNPKAKVEIPGKGKDPVGAGDNIFSKWTIKADNDTVESDYTFGKRQIYDKDSTITAKYGTGKIKIVYLDENNKEIDTKYQITGQDYPSEKSGGLGGEADQLQFPSKGPKFKGYVFNIRDDIKGKYYKDPKDPDKLDTVTYKYNKKVTTKDPNNDNAYFKVVFDANGGSLGQDTQKTLWVYMFTGDNPVTFEEARAEIESEYGLPNKDKAEFKEWQDKADDGSKIADGYVVKVPNWDWTTYPEDGYTPEIFYAHYEQASALVKYLDLDGKPIADEFRIDTENYPTEKEGKAGETIANDVFTEETAPKFTGYKFNRIELNPKDGKYSLDKKTTIKIYYEKVPDVIPANPDGSNPDSVPEDYVRVEFVPTDKGSMDGDKVFFVNPKKEVTIPVSNPKANATYKFKEWKMGANAEGEKYTPSTPKKFTQDTTITATYEETENIIPYDPSVPDPMVRPDGYVRVTFAADPGLKLTEQKAYYVKKNAGITLGNAELEKPGYEAQTGYKFTEWDKNDETIINTDIVVTAKATKLDNVIPEKDKNDKPNEKPKGYKEVTFVVKTGDEVKGSITGVAKFYVNPTEYVTINPPATSANTGYEFGAWDKDATIPTVYKDDATITGSFNGLSDVIPKTKDDDSEKPKGYVTVSFEIEGQGGKIAEGEKTTYFVNPSKEVTINPPKTQADTGYEFKEWDKDTSKAKKYDQDTTVKGSFKKLDDIIPSTDDNGKPNAKPKGYVTVTFEKGDNGKSITGQTVYYVNPKADPVKTLGDTSIAKPTVKAETGYKFTGWNIADTKEILSDITVTAQYKPIDDVIPKDKPTGGENEKPDGYITVTFEKGANGELEGNTTFYVNPNKAVVLEDKAPTIKPNTGYTSAGWDTSINKAIQYKDGDKITALYNERRDVIPQENPDGTDKPAGYLTVTFDKGDHGKEITGKTVYYVKPNKEVTVPAPTVKPETGWKQKDGDQAWDSLLTQTFSKDTTIKAQYEELKNIIPGDQTKPDGYVTVTFEVKNGSLAGTTKYFVKPGVEVDLSDKADALTKIPDLGYTAEGGTWSPVITEKQYTSDESYKFNFVKLDDIIPETDENGNKNEQPKGYVKVEFRTDKNGILEGNTIFYVNPNAKKTMADITAPTIKANKGYKVGTPNWHADFTKDTTEIKEDRIYVANYESLGESKITYIPRDPEMGSVSPSSEDLSEDEDIKGSTATPKPGYEFVKWVDEKNVEVSDKETFIPKNKVSAVFIAVFKPKDPMTFTAKKVWKDDVNPVPTMNFTLYRKVKDSQDQPVEVPGAEVKEITKTKTEATWNDLPKVDSNDNAFEYSVKETFKDENSDVKNANWILGQMETVENGNNTITNKLKTVPGENDTPDENKHRMAKLTITKKIESTPINKVISMFRAPAAPMEFTFKVTDPYGKEETFKLKAGESKELDHLLYGEYTVEETDAKGLTPFVKINDGKETESNTGKVTLSKDAKEASVTFTNKNVKPSNPHIIEVKATKIWSGGPSTDHTAVDLKLYRQVDGGQKEEVKGVTPDTSRDAKDTSKFNYVWKDLSRINDDGKAYTYSIEEANVTDNKVKVGNNTYEVSQEGNTITNTYQVPKGNIEAEKVWEGLADKETPPTTYFKLYRKLDDCKECQPVENADVKELPAGTAKVTWEKQDLTDENGNKYIYSVKEVDANGNDAKPEGYVKVEKGLTVTNTKIAKDGKITITKKLENVPTRTTYSTRSAAEPIKFKFTITKPDGTSEEFQLGANESKTFKNLGYGKYTVKETQTQGYTPYFAIGDSEQTQSEKFVVAVNSSDEVNLTVTNKNVINQNDLTVRATKIWVGGPEADHTAVTLQLLRTSAKVGSSLEDVTNEYRLETLNNGKSDTITYVWRNLPKHDTDGYEYSYEVKELGVGTDKIYKVGENSYRSEITKDTVNTNGETIAFNITNTFQDPERRIVVAGHKKWEKVPDDDAVRPVVKFQLMRIADKEEEQKVGEPVEVAGDPDQNGLITVSFGYQDKYNANEDLYSYYVVELDANGEVINDKSVYEDASQTHKIKTTYDLVNMTVTNAYVGDDVEITPGEKPPVPTPTPKPTPEPEPEPNPNPEPEPEPNPEPSPDVIPTPSPDDNPIVPGDEDKEKDPDKEKDKDPDKEKTPEKDKDKTPEKKPEEKTPDKEKEKPPVEIDTNKKPDKPGKKVVETIGQAGSKVVNGVKDFLNPKTGIITNYEIYLGLIAASSVGLFFTREKKNKDEE
uniref:Cna B-type domain-containing protein n=1 Tax=Anaerococcus mediterraneensis TaxID=1870984 RepID=UPI001390080A|nr:Cna B-type domain-containing protein [Anaerococcus mediterraneensis]